MVGADDAEGAGAIVGVPLGVRVGVTLGAEVEEGGDEGDTSGLFVACEPGACVGAKVCGDVGVLVAATDGEPVGAIVGLYEPVSGT